jgi:spore maturation protein CgeB
MGHQVVTPDRWVDRPRHIATKLVHELRQKAFPQVWSEAERWVVAHARDAKPDLVLCLTQSLREDVLNELRKTGARCVAWWGDPPANMRGLGLLVRGWDLIFIKDAAAVAKFRAVGLPAELLHEAMNPLWHCRNFTTVGEAIIVAGSSYGYRQILLERLLEAGEPMALYGPQPPRWATPVVQKVHRGKFIVKHEKSRIFGEGLACLNSTTLAEGNSLNCRAFEIAGACGLQLIENKPAVATCFEPGREVLVYDSVEEISEHLQRARRDPAWAMAVREAGHSRALAHHTYELRLRHILAHSAQLGGGHGT